MPSYRYNCSDCCAEFTRMSTDRKTGVVCPSCGSSGLLPTMPKVVPSVSYQGTAMGTPDTGLTGVDYDVDRRIGEDAAQKWKIIAQRRMDKHQMIADNPGLEGRHIKGIPNMGLSYSPMTEEEKNLREKADPHVNHVRDEIHRRMVAKRKESEALEAKPPTPTKK